MSPILNPLEWRTEQRRVRDLIPFEYNPRILTESKKELLRASVERFNLVEIPAINTDNKTIAGHQRLVILMDLGRGDELIDVRVPNRPLTEEEFKEYNIRSNVSIGEWDIEILNSIFTDIDLLSLGLNVEDIPLPEDNLPEMLQSEEESDFEPVVPKDPVSVLGDVYEFRSLQKKLVHRLVCGDSAAAETYTTLLQGQLFDLIVTDPPYNINYEGGTKDKLKIMNDNMSDDGFYTFLFQFYAECYANSRPGAPIYVFHADTEGVNFRKAFKEAGYKMSQCLIWLKNSIVMGRQDYHWKHEPVLYGWKEGSAHPWYSDRKQSTILEFDRPTRNDDHPTMKPIPLILYLIKNSSQQRELVGDSFSGSGTTLIACEQSWRQARVIELDPGYTDVNVRRYVKYMRENHLHFEVIKNGQPLTVEQLDQYFL